MSAIPDKIEYRDCSPEKAESFVAALENSGIAVRVSFSAASDVSHFDRYGFDCAGRRLGVVYDRKAKILSVTAPDDVSERIKKLYAGLKIQAANPKQNQSQPTNKPKSPAPDSRPQKKTEAADAKLPNKNKGDADSALSLRGAKRRDNLPEGKTDTTDTKAAKKSVATDTNNSRPHPTRGVPKAGGEITKESRTDSARSATGADAKTANKTVAAESENSPARAPRPPEGKTTVPDAKTAKKTPVTETIDQKKTPSADKKSPQKPPADNKTSQKQPQKPVVTPDVESQGGNLSFKKFTEERFGDVIARLKKRKEFKVAAPTVQDKGKQTETVTIVVASGSQKLKLRFMPKKQVLQVQGKQESLFSEVRLVVSEESDFKSAVTAHAESADKKASEFNRQLKKLMPTAVRYMSEQVKLDFTIGVIEILDSSSEHYDYSMLLLPPFRGLERFIFDIQRAQNVVVKMIGQAYEKENGEYVLKASYRRKINSVVYPEVLGALYREYFATRNFYTHSDAVGGENRVISTRKQAVDVFTHLCEVVEYNCRKLDEIRFSIAPPDKKQSAPKK